MSKVKTTRVWNGLPVDEITNTETGVVELYSQPTKGAMGSTTPGTLLLLVTQKENGLTTINQHFAADTITNRELRANLLLHKKILIKSFLQKEQSYSTMIELLF